MHARPRSKSLPAITTICRLNIARGEVIGEIANRCLTFRTPVNSRRRDLVIVGTRHAQANACIGAGGQLYRPPLAVGAPMKETTADSGRYSRPSAVGQSAGWSEAEQPFGVTVRDLGPVLLAERGSVQ